MKSSLRLIVFVECWALLCMLISVFHYNGVPAKILVDVSFYWSILIMLFFIVYLWQTELHLTALCFIYPALIALACWLSRPLWQTQTKHLSLRFLSLLPPHRHSHFPITLATGLLFIVGEYFAWRWYQRNKTPQRRKTDSLIG